jgi:signal transduction histidine kinase
VRTKSSSTAHESDSEVQKSLPYRGVERVVADASVPGREALTQCEESAQIVTLPPANRAVQDALQPALPGCAQQDDGILHDVRNLVSAVSLYCDLLSMPHVLRPEHRHYADELRLLGQRSAALIERLIGAAIPPDRGSAAGSPSPSSQDRRAVQSGPNPSNEEQPRLEPLRPMVERCAGLLHCVAGGQAVEIVYGDASACTVRIPVESLERILVNLVRNAAAAMGRRRGHIRVGVGLRPSDALTTRPWPFQRIRLVVEDSGCGMAPAELEQLLANSDPSVLHLPASHGIGFRVVRELVQASRGELCIHSSPGQGTRVEIEWPVASLEVHRPAIRECDATFAGHSRRSA